MTPTSPYHNKAVLVTGGAGFIGSHLVDALVALGAHVTVLDNFSTGAYENLAVVRDKIKIISGTVTDLEFCLQATQHVDTIFHLAALVSVPESCNNPNICHTTNVTGTFNLLEAARRNQCQKFVFSSSAAVYGAREGICSEATPCSPCSPYGLSKFMGELYCQQYAALYGIQTVILRYFNVYGSRQKPTTGVVAHFQHCLASGSPLTIHGDGLQERDFVPVDTIVQANLLLGAGHAYIDTESPEERIFNIATGTSISLITLVNRLKTQYPDYAQPITFAPARPGDIKFSVADCSRFKALISQLEASSLGEHPSLFYGILGKMRTEINL